MAAKYSSAGARPAGAVSRCNMFPKSNRLPASEIRSVLRSNNRVSVKEFQLSFTKNTLGVSRFAVIVSNKIDKRATARNRIKRLVRESVRHLLPMVQPGWDSVIIARTQTDEEKQKRVEEILQQVFFTAKILQ